MKQQLRQMAIDLGCAGCGVADASEFPDVAATLRERDEAGLSGRRRFTYKNPERAADVRLSFAWAKTLVVLSWSYLPVAGSPGTGDRGTGRIARFATSNHYEGLRVAANAIREELIAAGFRAAVLVDDDRLVDRAAAVRAGVAWWGKSTMVLDPRHGPWLLLGSVVTDATLPIDQPMQRDCGSCDACIPACPTGAIVAPGVLDASRCLAHWLQTAGVFPTELRIPMGDRIYGCDDCLEACPPGWKRLGTGLEVRGRVDLLEILASSDEALLERYDHFYLPGRRPRILRRNALIALGNSWYGRADEPGGAAAVSVLAGFLDDPEEVLRIHAAWALGRIGGELARTELMSRQHTEAAPAVIREIELAMYASTGTTECR